MASQYRDMRIRDFQGYIYGCTDPSQHAAPRFRRQHTKQRIKCVQLSQHSGVACSCIVATMQRGSACLAGL
jgi:hypothetical protein